MPRGQRFAILGWGLLGLLAWGAWLAPGSQDSRREGGVTPGTTSRLMERRAATAASLEQDPGHERPGRIRGAVVDTAGTPVAGVRVSATRREAESLAEQPCPEDALLSGWDEIHTPPRLLRECRWTARDIVVPWLTNRQGEARILAETLTAKDGTFVLEGLSDGPVALWALSSKGVALQQGILAGRDDLLLALSPGILVENTVTGGDAPLPGARITLVSLATDRYFEDSAGLDGTFRIGPLPYGEYVFMAEHEGWRSEFVYLIEGTFPRMEDIRLARPLSHRGRVIANGAPVAGARVALHADETYSGSTSWHFSATDEQGMFHFDDLAAGKLELAVQHNGLTARADISLHEDLGQESLLELQPAPLAEGLVLDEQGHPISGARVTAKTQAPGTETLSVTTGRDGRYQLGPLWLKTVHLEVAAPGYITSRTHSMRIERMERHVVTLTRAAVIAGVAVDARGAPVSRIKLRLLDTCAAGDGHHADTAMTDDAGRFELGACRPGDIDIHLDDERFISKHYPVRAPSTDARIELEHGTRVQGIAMDAQGTPVSGAYIQLQGSTSAQPQHRSITSDAQGRFVLGTVHPGKYTLSGQIEMPGILRTATLDIELTAAENPPVALQFPQGSTLSGIAVTPAGRPLAGVFVRATPTVPTPASEPPRHYINCGEHSAVRTDADGRFTLPHLTSEFHELVVQKPDHEFLPHQSSGGTTDQDERFLVSQGTNSVRLVLQRQSHVRGRLLGPDGAPIPEFTVDGRRTLTHDGAFKWATLVAGRVTYVIQAPGLAPHTVSADLPMEGELDLGDVHLSQGRGLSGQLVDAVTGRAIAGATLTVHTQGSSLDSRRQWHDTDTSKTDGTFGLSHLSDALMELTVQARGYRSHTRLVSGGQDVEIRLMPGIPVEVQVVDKEGRFIDATLQFWEDQHEGAANEVRAFAGKATHPGLDPGIYTVVASPAPSADSRVRRFTPQRVHVTEGSHVALTLTEQPSGVTVTVHAPGGEPGHHLSLHPGRLPAPQSPAAAEVLSMLRGFRNGGEGANAWIVAEGQLATKHFHDVPPGPVTLLMVSAYDPRHFHREELTIPESGSIVHTVVPRWQSTQSP